MPLRGQDGPAQPATKKKAAPPPPPSPQAPLRLGEKPRSCIDAADEQCNAHTVGRRQRLCLVVPFFCVHVLPSATAARPANKIALFTHPFLLPLWIIASLRSAAPPQSPLLFNWERPRRLPRRRSESSYLRGRRQMGKRAGNDEALFYYSGERPIKTSSQFVALRWALFRMPSRRRLG
ncbi:hypothetical protein FA10DRAFT_85178 [Acaromyces ingoldii]|uniref:Uncharacterized protein n=1 Tax=Acaromyces ingoldii TaxID=215250 RepID=A0A316YRG0_9BASI|nr:hypothetical protein FA10DRAFT_85178 [Acaromyces ingoldii]PWN92140.1 hypothetical protein FA10DRAFT_85178 [Acaromyces ingoldii]